MATTYADRSNLDKLFKYYYEPRIREQYYKETPLATRIKKRTDPSDFNGRKAVIAAKYQRSEAVGARAESANLPTASFPKFANMEVDVALQYGSVKATRPAMKASRSDAGAWARVLTEIMNDIRESLLFDVARQLVYGDGSGKLAQVNGAGTASTTLTVDNPGTRFLRPGMVIDIYDGATRQVDSVKIESVDSETQVTLATAGTWSDNAWVYREDAKDVECMGLGGIVDDGTRLGTFQNLSRTVHPWLNANRLANGGTPRALTLELIDEAYLRAETNGSGGYPTAIYSRHMPMLKYAQLLRTDRRFEAKQMTLDGGFKAVEYTGPGGTCPWIADRMVRDGEVLFVHEPDFGLWVLDPLGFVDDDGTVLKWVSGKDEFEAYLAEYSQFGAHRCNRHTVLADVSE